MSNPCLMVPFTLRPLLQLWTSRLSEIEDSLEVLYEVLKITKERSDAAAAQ